MGEQKTHHVSPFIKGFAGSMGGVMEACCLQPIDVIKTRLQLDRTGRYTGIVQCGNKIIAEEGVRSLWKGLTPFATHLTCKYALRMTSNSVYQNLLRDKEGKLTDSRRMAAGFMAGVTEALIIVTPFEVVKIRLQQQKGMCKDTMKYHGPIHCATTIIRAEGPLGLWAGAAPTVLRNGTNQMCLFTAKPAADVVLWGKHEGDGKQLTPTQSMLSGFLAACLGPVATGPFDVIKTRLMAQEKAAAAPAAAAAAATGSAAAGSSTAAAAAAAAAPPHYKGFLDALVRIPREEGLRACWRGLLPRLMRIPPGQAIVWAVSDQITGYFERHGWDGPAPAPATSSSSSEALQIAPATAAGKVG